MLEIKFIRKNPEAVRSNLARRNNPVLLDWFDDLMVVDAEQRRLLQEVEQLRGLRNKLTENVKELKKAGKDTAKAMKEAGKVPAKIKEAEEQQEKLAERMKNYLMRLPNVLHESVPVGKDDSENAEVREWGGKKIPCDDPKSHVDLLAELDVGDMERAARISGARFYYLKNELVLLDYALQHLALEMLFKKGFTLVEPPHMMKRAPYEGVTDLNDFKDVMYKIEDEDLYLIATSEHPLVSMHWNEILEADKLPIKYAGISPCYRKEAGAHGKDTKGIFRTHQFNKVEQVVLCKPEQSWKIHEELIGITEEFFRKIEIPYRIVNVCTGDIGIVAAKKYDLEGWFPAQGAYRELGSCSNCTSYQAARLGLRYRTGKKNAKGEEEKELVHTLNNTMVATGRAMVAIMENHQQDDGSISVPKALRPHMAGIERISKKK